MLPTANGVPPVGVAYQSTVVPGAAFTINAGVAVPSQMTGKLGPLGADIVGQPQFGATAVCVCEHVVRLLLAVTLTLVPLGIPVMV